MKTSVLLGTLLFGMIAQAADVNQNNISNNQLSRRPYHEVPDESKDVHWEGDVLIIEKVQEETKHEPMRLHMLGKRPYAVKSPE